jgi:aspartate/methionine/tyrosine aminotransferase
MRRLNPQLTDLHESATVALGDRVRRLRASGSKVIGLQTGDPDFPTPQPIIDAARRAMNEGHTHYGDSRGLPELRQAIADKLRRTNHVGYDPAAEILVTCGGIHAYYCALASILTQGDEVLIPDPAWMTHANVVTWLGGRAVRVPGSCDNNFWPTFADWERAVSSRTVALVVNSPNNPTGAVADKGYLSQLNQFADVHNLYVISDEVYENILYDGRGHTCFASLVGAKERTLLVNSLSKTYAMTGWRVGYLAAPTDIIASALKASQHSITNLAPFIQRAAAFALTDSAMQEAARQMTLTYTRRRDMVMQLWRDSAPSLIPLNEPQGAFYFFVDVRALGMPSVQIAEQFLEEASVALVPGSTFGACGEGFLRLTIAAADTEIEAGFKALLQWCGTKFAHAGSLAAQ